MDPYHGQSKNRRNRPNQQPRFDNNYYPGGPRPPQRQGNPQQSGVRATMPPPPGQGFALPPPTHGQQPSQPPADLDGTMAHPNDPFWLRRRYTRNDSFPELRELDFQNQQQCQQNHSQRSQHQQRPHPNHSQRSQQQQPQMPSHRSESRSRRKHQHQPRQQGPPRQSSKQGDRSYPKPPTQAFHQQTPVATFQNQGHPKQNSSHRRHHRQQPPQFQQPQPQRHANKRKEKRDVTQPQMMQTPQFGNQQSGFRLPPFSPNFKGPRPKSQFAPPSPTPPVHLPKSSSKPRFQSNYSPQPSNQGLTSGSSFTPKRAETRQQHPHPPKQHQQMPMVPRRGRQLAPELGLDVLMSKTFAKKKNMTTSGNLIPPPSGNVRQEHGGAPPLPPKVPSRQFRSRDVDDDLI